MAETYIDADTVGCLREDGLSDALMDLENHTILVVTYHYIDDEPQEYERFTMLDWWAPDTVANSVLKSHKHFVENGNVDAVRVTVGSINNEDILYTARWEA